MIKYASIKFEGTIRGYHFKTDLDLVIGDKVVCDTSKGLVVGEVKRVTDVPSTLATKWIVDKVDLSKHQQRLELEKKRKNIKLKMEERKQKLEEIAIYEMLAKEDKEMAKLVEEYNSMKEE